MSKNTKLIVAMFYWGPEEPPLMIIPPRLVDEAIHSKIKEEFNVVLKQQEDIISGRAPDECYESAKVKEEYTTIHRGDSYSPLYAFSSMDEILELLGEFVDESDELNDDKCYLAFKKIEIIRSSEIKDLFIEKHGFEEWRLGLGYIPTEIGKLILLNC